MIRMGRNSKTEQPDAPDYQSSSPTSQTSYQYGADQPNTVSKPTTDSESIARDIKEGKLSGFVGHGTSLSGDTTFQMMLRVDGHLTGTVSSEGGTLIVGNSGQLDANVSVGTANINGTINGDVAASEKIHLGRTGKVVGNITTPKLVIEDGALFEGSCSMVKARETEQAAIPAPTETQYQASSYSSYSSSSTTTADDDDDVTGSVEDDDDDEERADAASS
ncbi:MAG TPA: polymer-forming cytoskeletal protein [Pyrinomonadaceae bacterium]|nr:polymer-forming cytoskeletal protein [Pyrinomonadaceae bacterium]HMP64702.1 polymer-forming cytoskeletal protein [Pyrinomonadaceae bacterium]